MMSRFAERLRKFVGGAESRVPTARAAANHFYRRLGVNPIINATGTFTRLGGSIMPPEVIDAMVEAATCCVDLDDLLFKAGRHIAKLICVPAALITNGASSAITIGTAACMTGTDEGKIRALPDSSGMKNEVVVLESHCSEETAGIACGYLSAIKLSGAKFIRVADEHGLAVAINERTAMLHFVNYCEPFSEIPRRRWSELGKKYGVPTFLDAAGDMPPKHRLVELLDIGFDLLAISGSKGFRGPQCSGLLVGREDLIRAAAMNMCPNVNTIGRGFKIGKEEIAGLVAAVERFWHRDEALEYVTLQDSLVPIQQALKGINGIQTEIYMPEERNVYPHLRVFWLENVCGFDAKRIAGRLLDGVPPISVRIGGSGADALEGIGICSFTLRPGEPEIIATQLRTILEEEIIRSQTIGQ